MNAAEALGVRVVRPIYERRHRGEADLKGKVIQFAQEEEDYHTRILVGSGMHFDIQVTDTYAPKLALRALIHLEQGFAEFDLGDLPVEVRSRGFFA